MNTAPLISVVVPCRDRAAYLRPTLDSILGQDYPAIECIVVDAQSTDGTLEILRSYGDRIRWISEPDQGPADAINKGWRMGRGEILAWLNADDVWELPHAAGQAVAYLNEHPNVDVVYGDCGRIDAQGAPMGKSYLHEWDLTYAVTNCDHCIPQPSAFMRRRILEKIGWLDISLILMDRDLWYRAGLTGSIAHVPHLLAHARYHASYWHSRSHAVADDCVRVIRKFFDNPDLPATWRPLRRRALSNAHLRGMEYAWRPGCRRRVACRHALGALITDPTNGGAVMKRLMRLLKDGNPESCVCRCLSGLARGGNLLRRVWRHQADPPAAGAVVPMPVERVRNLKGDRDIEWSWIAAHLPPGPGEALDFGTGGSFMSLAAAQRGFNVLAIDLREVLWPYTHPRLRFIQGDLFSLNLPDASLDLVINCSTIEHVGLSGRYGVAEDRQDGDLEAMARLQQLLKPGGTMLLTIPMGRDAVFAPMTRVYGAERLPQLLAGFKIVTEACWVKDEANQWVVRPRREAEQFEAAAGASDPKHNVYALGCFVLQRAA